MGWFGDGGKHQENAAKRQHEYDNLMYEYNLQLRDDKYEFQLDQYEIQKWNSEALRNYKNETAVNDWKYRESMRQFDFTNQVEAFNASMDNYHRQMDFNVDALNLTHADNTRKYNEQLIAIGFKHEGLVNDFGFKTGALDRKLARQEATAAYKGEELKLNALGNAGTIQNLGQSGRTAAKNMQSAMAMYGMKQDALNDAILRDQGDYEFGYLKANVELEKGGRELKESMKSARAQYASDQQHALMQKYAADMKAENNIAPEPVMPPQMPPPLELPEAKTLAPPPPGTDPPRPVMGAYSKGPSAGQQLLGMAVQLGAAALGGWAAGSDDRLKRNITRVGTSPSGIPKYTFNYVADGGHGPTYMGTSAQDLLAMGRDDAVVQKEKDGFYYVDYSKLDVDMEQVQLA